MKSRALSELDLIEELRLRSWARENYVPRERRQHAWHAVVHDEMTRKETEGGTDGSSPPHYAWSKS